MKNARLNNFTIQHYSYQKGPTGSGTIYFDGGHLSFTLEGPEVADIMAMIFAMVQRRKGEIAESVMNLETPLLLTSDAQTIEGASLKPAHLDEDNIPF